MMVVVHIYNEVCRWSEPYKITNDIFIVQIPSTDSRNNTVNGCARYDRTTADDKNNNISTTVVYLNNTIGRKKIHRRTKILPSLEYKTIIIVVVLLQLNISWARAHNNITLLIICYYIIIKSVTKNRHTEVCVYIYKMYGGDEIVTCYYFDLANTHTHTNAVYINHDGRRIQPKVTRNPLGNFRN